jgi:hypothetical protein
MLCCARRLAGEVDGNAEIQAMQMHGCARQRACTWPHAFAKGPGSWYPAHVGALKGRVLLRHCLLIQPSQRCLHG